MIAQAVLDDVMADSRIARLRMSAPAISALYFGRPVYLVGGALSDPDPRDLDVVVILPDTLFVLCYGDNEGRSAEKTTAAITAWSGQSSNPNALWRRWARDCAKWNERLAIDCHRRVDFKTQPEMVQHRFAGKPRVRLDAEDA